MFSPSALTVSFVHSFSNIFGDCVDPMPQATIRTNLAHCFLAFNERRMEFDDLVWERDEETQVEFIKCYLDKCYLEARDTLLSHVPGDLNKFGYVYPGAFNLVHQVHYHDRKTVAIRFALGGYSDISEEKQWGEVEVLSFLETYSRIPVPHVLYHGLPEGSRADLGSCMIMDWIPHETTLSKVLGLPGLSDDDRQKLNPDVPRTLLESSYGQVADILLDLAKYSFSAIGSLGSSNDGNSNKVWDVTYRPLTFNMILLSGRSNFPLDLFPQTTFKTASSYYIALAELHLLHLSTQHNDAVYSADDCRRKYVARCLFRKLARDGRLHDGETENGPFKLFCDDFRPGNILTDKQLNIVGVIDWEFTYAAPLGFVYSPPFWLLIEYPELWPEGLADWIEKYEQCLSIFLEVLRSRETAAIERGDISEDQTLSSHMKKSWDNGDFWVNYAARKSWAFDMIYWAKIDERFYGKASSFEDRLELLTPDELAHMDSFVQRKMAEKEERILVDWSETDSKQFIIP